MKMKNILLPFSLLIIFVLLMPFSYARHAKELKVERINVMDGEMAVNVRVKNNLGDMHVKFSAVVPELGVMASRGPFKLEKGDRASRTIMLEEFPESASGEYVVRIVVRDGDVRRVKHRLIII